MKKATLTLSLDDWSWILTAVKLRQEASEENQDHTYAKRWKKLADKIREATK